MWPFQEYSKAPHDEAALGNQQPAVAQLRPVRHVQVVTVPRAPPGGPAPVRAVAVRGVVVGVVVRRLPLVHQVVPDDRPDPLVMPVVLEQFLREAEPGGVGQAVVLHDEALFFLLEEPFHRVPRAVLHALVHIAESRLELAGPVHQLGQIPDPSHLRGLLGLARSWGVHREVEPGRAGRTDRLEYGRALLHAPEGDEEHGGAHRVGLAAHGVRWSPKVLRMLLRWYTVKWRIIDTALRATVAGPTNSSTNR